MTSTPVGLLRIAMALGVLGSMIAAGALGRSAWLIAVAAPVFTALYALGKWNAWRLAWRLQGAGAIAKAALTTLPVQAALAGVLYLIGLGIGRLIPGGGPIAPFSSGDLAAAAALSALGLAVAALIVRLDDAASASASTPAPTPVALEGEGRPLDVDLELDIDPTPLTPETFFTSPPYWRTNASFEALANRGVPIVKPPLAAREDMIAAAEARLGIRLPAGLRALYARMNGGSVGALYVAWKPDPQPVFEDWRGAFSIDYSSLRALEGLRTVADHYEDVTHDPEDVPENADRLVILEARYGDMTLLDYSKGPEPRVLLVDFDKAPGEDPVDVAFDDFDAFFAALRRERDEFATRPPRPRPLSPPLRDVAEAERGRQFWGEGGPHALSNPREGQIAPKPAADAALIAETEARLGLTLPPALAALYAAQNGGGAAWRFLAETAPGGASREREIFRRPAPLEHVASLAALSDRVTFPPGETPWRERHDGAERLFVLEADHGRAVLLDGRAGTGAPALLVVEDLDGGRLEDAARFDDVDKLVLSLRCRPGRWDDVSKPCDDAPGMPPA